MIVYFKEVNSTKLIASIDLGPFAKSGMDISPMDIPLKGDTIADDYNRLWEVVGREHCWTGSTHYMILHLKQL